MTVGSSLEFARTQVRTLTAEVCAGIRPIDDADLAEWRARVAHLSTNTERGPQ